MLHRLPGGVRVQFGLIGYGAVGRQLVAAQEAGQLGRARLGALLVRSPEKLDAAERQRLGSPVCGSLEEFLATPIRVAVETAGQTALRQYAAPVLESGRDLLVISYGAFGDAAFYERCLAAADRGGSRLLIASASLAGLDGIQAAATGHVSEVVHSVRKPPHAWLGTPAEQMVDLTHLREPFLIYDGPARGAVTRFPANVNVGCAVALAGIGLDRSRLQIWADPYITVNVQEIRVIGALGTIQVSMQDVPSDNPKSGRLTYGGLIKALRNLAGPVMIGV